MLLFSYYLEYFLGLSPCIICEIQRYILLPLLALSLFMFNSGAFFGLFSRAFRFVLVIASVFLSWHHINIINSGTANNNCLPGIMTILRYHGFDKAWDQILQGNGSCSKVVWDIMGIGLPYLTFAAYIMLLFICLYEFYYFYRK